VTITSSGHFIDVQITAIQGEFCFGDGSGAATISAVPTPSGNVVSIVWTDPLGGTIPGGAGNTSQTNMMPGIWTVCITDDVGSGCEVCIPVEITAPQELDIFVDNSNEPVCYAFSDGSIDVGITGGTSPHVFSWSHDPGITGDVANTITAGNYWAYVTDDNGCQDSIEIDLGQPDSLYGEFIIKDIDCYGDSTGGIITTDVFNNQGNYTYNWNLQGTVPNPPNSSNSAGGLPAGTYVMTLLDENGCNNEYQWTLTENTEIVLTDSVQSAYCRLFGSQSGNGVLSGDAIGGVPDYEYIWTNLGTGDSTTNTTWGARNPGMYQFTAIDELGCVMRKTIELDSVNPIAAFTVLSAELDANCEGTAPVVVQFTNQSEYFANPNNPNSDTTFFWNLNHGNFPNDWWITHDINAEVDTTYTGEAIYEACLVAINKNGCTDTTCKTIIVHDQPILTPPNVFTPGGGAGSANEFFEFQTKSQAVETFSAVIVNRWGKVVFEFSDISQQWDGNTPGGSPCKDGVYFYTYELTFTNSETEEGQGNITLIRE
jgi:gliding motility-associated-like protein